MTDDLWQMADGRWQMADGRWQMADDRWQMADGRWLFSYWFPFLSSCYFLSDLDPCMNVTCNYFAVCKAFAAKDARCVCVENCPSYEEPVCSSNGTTYDNECIFEREMCHLEANFTLYHPGSCTGE